MNTGNGTRSRHKRHVNDYILDLSPEIVDGPSRMCQLDYILRGTVKHVPKSKPCIVRLIRVGIDQTQSASEGWKCSNDRHAIGISDEHGVI